MDYYYFVLVLFPLINIYSVSLCGLLLFVLVLFPLFAMLYVSLCGLLLFCFGTVPSNWYVICQSVWIIIIFVLVLFPLISM